MPYTNEHSARLRKPSDFDPKTYRRTKDGTIYGRIKVPATAVVIWGKLKGRSKPSDNPIPQSMRFPTANWTAGQARKWLKDNNVKFILFEAAKPAKKEESGDENGFVRLSQPEALKSEDFKADREKGVMRNVSIITMGVAIGHDFEIDRKMLTQVRDSLKEKKRGVKCRLTHPRAGLFSTTDGIECLVGRAGGEGVKIRGDRVVGDIHFGKYAASSPKGNLWTYLFDLAEEDPEVAGLSIVFVPAEYEEREDRDGRITLPPLGRVKDVLAVDFVGDPGANPSGLPGS